MKCPRMFGSAKLVCATRAVAMHQSPSTVAVGRVATPKSSANPPPNSIMTVIAQASIGIGKPYLAIIACDAAAPISFVNPPKMKIALIKTRPTISTLSVIVAPLVRCRTSMRTPAHAGQEEPSLPFPILLLHAIGLEHSLAVACASTWQQAAQATGLTRIGNGGWA